MGKPGPREPVCLMATDAGTYYFPQPSYKRTRKQPALRVPFCLSGYYKHTRFVPLRLSAYGPFLAVWFGLFGLCRL
jgi:hypothetical protein